MKKSLLLLSVFMIISAVLFADIYEPEGLNMPGAWNGWANPPSNLALASYTQVSGGRVTKISTGTARWQTIFSVASSGADLVGGNYNWLFTSGSTGNPWSNKWANVTVSINTVQSYTYNSGSDNNISITNGKYYCMNWKDLGYTGTSAIFMELSASPITITSVSQAGYLDGSTYYAPPSGQVITITLSASKCAEEQIYVRYSTDGWTTDNFVLATGSGTSYSATIPAQSVGTSVNYYVLSSALTYSVGGDLDNNPDLCTIKYNNNTGSNYSYTVANPRTAQDGNWSSSSTWFFQAVPASTENVNILTTHDVIVDGSYTTNTLTINSGASVTINPDMALTVNGTLTNSAGNSGLRIESDATGTGSLIESSGVSATVEQYLTDSTWHFVSSPVSDALTGVFTGMYLRTFNESIDDWNPFILQTDVPLDVMNGYAAWVPDGSPANVSFQGTLNTGSQSISVTHLSTGTDQGWNFVGNPYPSALDWDGSGWTKTNVNNTIYFYSGTIGMNNYHYYIGSGGETPGFGVNDGTRYIPAMQGFFIHASAAGTLGVLNSARVHSGQAFYKGAAITEYPVIRLVASGNELTDEMAIRFLAEASTEFDEHYDAYKLFGDNYPQIFSYVSNQTQLAVNSLPSYDEETTIPVGFMPPTEGAYTIMVTEMSNFESGTELILEDLKTGNIQKISDAQPYTFNSSPIDEYNRFNLHFDNNMAVHENPSDQGINVYSYRKNVCIIYKDGLKGTVIVYDLIGKEVVREILNGESVRKINLNNFSGFAVVNVISDKGNLNEKVYIQ
ncbi:MAG: hypothetical protein FJY07_02595 [Bacteroidetes bacterium]|nr:hypothetical protein [Bacteroidota bacterium]